MTLIITTIITWKADNCETQNQESQAIQPPTNLMLTVPTTTNGDSEQKHSQNQTGWPASHADSYFCRVATPTNLPTIYLVLIGFGGIAVAIGTLDILERQTKGVEDSIEVLINKERARIYIEPDDFIFDTSDAWNPTFELKYRVTSSGTTPAIIYDSRVTAEVSTTQERSHPEQRATQIPLSGNLVPGEIELRISLSGEREHINEVLDEQIESEKLFVEFWG
ncbi:MAG TPA: hypothetical protein VNK23_17895 [Candidatus Dormibacteraeota bacterium]|nr:hypothetical protein [Candidatus Dormibacteraeota bacterium]